MFKDNILSNYGSGTVMHVTASTIDVFDNAYVVFEDNVGSLCGEIATFRELNHKFSSW